MADNDDLRELQNDAQRDAKKVPAARMKIVRKKAIAPESAIRNAVPVAVLMPVQKFVQNLDLARDPKAIAGLKQAAKIDPVAVLVEMTRSRLKVNAAAPDLVALVAVDLAAADLVVVLAARSVEDLAQAAPAQAAPAPVALAAVSDRAADLRVLGSLATRRVADEVVAAKVAPNVPNPTPNRINPKRKR